MTIAFKKSLIKAFIILMLPLSGYGQSAANDSLKQKRLKPLLITSGAVYTVSMVGLGSLWYSDFERQSFRFFNDNKEWKQVDKAGHFYSAFHISRSSYQLLKWSGLSEQKAMTWGTISSFLALTPIEIFDGFSSGFGASVGDLGANTLGAALFYMQYKVWHETRIHLKYYFRRSDYASQRPELLGSNLREELLKDYNAQEYWLSFDLSRFDPRLPKWLNIAVGYGASGMVFANDLQNEQNGFKPQRHYFIGLDLDLNEYRSGSKLINTLLYVLNMIRIPAPAVELTDKELKLHFIY